MAPRWRALTLTTCLAIAGARPAHGKPPIPAPAPKPQRVALVPEVAQAPFHVSAGPRRFVRRLSFSPGFGQLGNERLFVFRLAFNPNRWLGYEGTIGHNPGNSVHALFNTFNAIVRYPLPWRVQPYGSVGYGMLLVFPGEVFNADPVTKNALSVGGGLELYVRDDLAVRAEAKHTAVLGGERDAGGTVSYGYGEVTVGLSFYRSLGDH